VLSVTSDWLTVARHPVTSPFSAASHPLLLPSFVGQWRGLEGHSYQAAVYSPSGGGKVFVLQEPIVF